MEMNKDFLQMLRNAHERINGKENACATYDGSHGWLQSKDAFKKILQDGYAVQLVLHGANINL